MLSKPIFTLKNPKNRILLLLLGTILLILTKERGAIHLLGWVAPVPFLMFLRVSKGRRDRFLFMGIFCLGFIVAMSKYFQPPWPRVMALGYGIPLGVAHGAGYLIWDRLRQGIPDWLGNLVFAASMIAMEWAMYTFSPFSSLGVAAHSQLNNLPLLQTVSLFGVCGLSFLLYWFSAVVTQGFIDRKFPLYQTSFVAGLVVLIHIWGTFRIENLSISPTATIAAIQTDFDWFGTPEIPTIEQRSKITDALFDRSTKAAKEGAKMVVWSEISNAISPKDEPELIKRGQAHAKLHGIHLVMSYLNILSMTPIKWENKYVWVNPKGEIVDTYLKHKPARPVEPAVKGKGVPKVVETGFGKAAGAICFDFDFPQIGLALAQNGADFVFLPAADTLSVDPFHTQMASIRAIEGGYSVVRATRHGTSVGIGPYGRFRGWLNANESNDKTLIVKVPAKSIWTLYKTIGNVLPLINVLFLTFLTGWKLLQRRTV